MSEHKISVSLIYTMFLMQALSQALLQVRADLVETAQRTLEGEVAREMQESSIKELVEKRTQQLQVCLKCTMTQIEGISHAMCVLSPSRLLFFFCWYYIFNFAGKHELCALSIL